MIDNRRNTQVHRLCERWISSLIADDKGSVDLEEVLQSYRNYVGINTIPDGEVLAQIRIRFPSIEIEYGESERIRGISYRGPIVVTSRQGEPLSALNSTLRIRFQDMINYLPRYKDTGISAQAYAAYTKSSIMGGRSVVVDSPIDIKIATKYLESDDSLECKNGFYFIKKLQGK